MDVGCYRMDRGISHSYRIILLNEQLRRSGVDDSALVLLGRDVDVCNLSYHSFRHRKRRQMMMRVEVQQLEQQDSNDGSV